MQMPMPLLMPMPMPIETWFEDARSDARHAARLLEDLRVSRRWR
jgi:hypothetical protein